MITHPVSEKLAKANHATWKAQVVATMRGARLEGYLTGKAAMPAAEIEGKDGDKVIKIPNPAYEDWVAADQQVLSFLLASVSKEVLIQISSKKTAAEAWRAIETMFSSQTRARAVNTRLALSTTRKESSSVAEYVGKMKSLGDEMAAAGRPLEDDELVEYILTGLDEDYDSVVSSALGRAEPISVSELYSQMLAFETRMNLRNNGNSSGSSANAANAVGVAVQGALVAAEDVVAGTLILLHTMVVVATATTTTHDKQIKDPETTLACQIRARCVSKRATPPTDAGTGTMRILFLIQGMLLLPPQPPTPWIQTGTRIRGLLII